MECTRAVLPGGAIAWYPTGVSNKAAVLVWMAPADGAWAVYLELLGGLPRRHEGLDQVAAEATAESALAADGWRVVA